MTTSSDEKGAASAPRVLIAGLGRFGVEHLETWRALEREGEARVVGALVSSAESAARNSARHKLPVHHEWSDELLGAVDVVDIATPSANHYESARRCLERCDVLVEKPLALEPAQAKDLEAVAARLGRVLAVNHLYRHHPATAELRRVIAELGGTPLSASGKLLNPAREAEPGLDIDLEFLHLLDLLDYLFGKPVRVSHGQARGAAHRLSLMHDGGFSAVLDVGWEGLRRVRELTLRYPGRRVRCDFTDGVVEMTSSDGVKKTLAPESPRPLEASLRAFLRAVRSRDVAVNGLATAAVGRRAVETAVAVRPKPRRPAPRVAVIGGGVFGAVCALESARFGEVALFERHPRLLTEASFANQWRHHSGFHYPRSFSTVHEIQECKVSFDEAYPEVILPIDSYYATAASGSTITKKRYLDMCQGLNLRFTEEAPPERFLKLDEVTLCVKSDERVLDVPAMRELLLGRLRGAANIDVGLGTEVVGGRLESDGSKTLTVRRDGDTREESFDYVVNAGYANCNQLARWFGLPVRRMRFDLCEIVALEIDRPPVTVTVLDGPFVSLVATGRDNIFLLSQAEHSVLWSVLPPDGSPPAWREPESNRRNMLRHARTYFPVIEEARFVESRYALRAVEAYNEDFDARPTVVTAHGFGCWSILGGKILTCVSNAREIAREIEQAEAA